MRKDKQKNIKIESINVISRGGKSPKDCLKESIQLSFEHDTTVLLYHNNSKFVINSRKIEEGIWDTETTSGRME